MKQAVFSVLLVLSLTVGIAAAPAYKVIEKIPVPGDGGWDYLTLDAANHRLFVARATRVQVLDLDSKTLAGEIPDTAGVHGVALASDVGKGYTSNGRSSTVTVFDLKTLKVLQQVPVGKKPDAIVYDAKSKRVFTMNGDSEDSTAIDTATDKVVGTVPLGGGPEFAASDGGGHIYVNLEEKNEVVEFDTSTLQVLGHWSLAPGEAPTGLAIDPRHHRLFIGCHNEKMVVFDTASDRVVATAPIGKGVDANGYDPKMGLAFSSNGDGTLTVVDNKKYQVVQTVETQAGARTMALDPNSHRVYLCTATVAHQPTAEERKQGKRTEYVPGSFVILVVGN